MPEGAANGIGTVRTTVGHDEVVKEVATEMAKQGGLDENIEVWKELLSEYRQQKDERDKKVDIHESQTETVNLDEITDAGGNDVKDM